METVTIFSALCTFLLASKSEIALHLIAHATYDGLKNVLHFAALKTRIKKFFTKEEDADKYLESICNKESKNISEPIRDIKTSYEELTGETFPNELYDEIKNWIVENADQITKVSKMDFSNIKGFNIGVQNAGKNIINIQGDYKPRKE